MGGHTYHIYKVKDIGHSLCLVNGVYSQKTPLTVYFVVMEIKPTALHILSKCFALSYTPFPQKNFFQMMVVIEPKTIQLVVMRTCMSKT